MIWLVPKIFTFLNLSTSIGKSTTEKEAGETRSHCKLATTQTDSKAVSLFGLGPPAASGAKLDLNIR